VFTARGRVAFRGK